MVWNRSVRASHSEERTSTDPGQSVGMCTVQRPRPVSAGTSVEPGRSSRRHRQLTSEALLYLADQLGLAGPAGAASAALPQPLGQCGDIGPVELATGAQSWYVLPPAAGTLRDGGCCQPVH